MNMSNNKRIFIFGLFIFSFFMFCAMNVNAAPSTTQAVEYVAENPCDENSIKTVMRLFGYVLLIARVAVPLIIIGLGTFDLAKSVIDKDEKSLGKQVKQLGIRILAGLIVFFVPNIVAVVFSMSDKLNIIETGQYKTCADCLLKPGNCNISDN